MSTQTKVNLPAVDLALMESVFDAQMMRGVAYGLGAKPPSLSCAPSAFSKVDCSGEARYLLYKGTNGQLVIPDGSFNQRGWFERKGIEQVSYSDVLKADGDDLFICFITPHTNGCGSVGHVWLVRRFPEHGVWTMESHGGRGVNSRPGKTPVLVRQVHKCFRLPTVPDARVTVPSKAVVSPQVAAPPKVGDIVSARLEQMQVNGKGTVPALHYEGHLYPMLVEFAEELDHQVKAALKPQQAGQPWRVTTKASGSA